MTFIGVPTGAGKTSPGTQLLVRAAERGHRSATYLFEEDSATYEHRSESNGMPVRDERAEGSLSVTEIEPRRSSGEEFAHMVEGEVESRGTDVVMIDGIDGYTSAIQGHEDDLIRKLHALTRY